MAGKQPRELRGQFAALDPGLLVNLGDHRRDFGVIQIVSVLLPALEWAPNST